jgi:hypothetical protein
VFKKYRGGNERYREERQHDPELIFHAADTTEKFIDGWGELMGIAIVIE